MGRGRDKTISLADMKNMSPDEQYAVVNAVRLGRVKAKGTALVRDRHGNARYEKPALKGKYGEDNVS